MRSFQYVRPLSLDEMFALLNEHGPEAKLLAGGTDLVVRLRSGRGVPRIVVDLKRVEELRADVVETGGCLRIGARAVMTDLIEDRRVRRYFSALVESAGVVGSVQIRNRATLAGNICNASPAADTVPALLVYGAIANLAGCTGRRRVPLTGFFLGPGRTVLNRGEILESIDLPLPSEPAGAAFGRIARRRGVDVASVNLCCLVKASGETLFGCGAVGPRAFLVRNASVEDLVEQSSPISDVRSGRDYRLAMLAVLGRRCLAAAMDQLQMETPCKR